MQEKLGWRRVHVVGHSMGAMVACKLAARAPELVVSLTLISVTGGGWQSVPRSFKALKLAVLVSPGTMRFCSNYARALPVLW